MALPQAPEGYRFVQVSGRAAKGTFSTNVRITGLKAAQEGLRALGVTDVPFVRSALTDIGNVLAVGMNAVKPHASFKVGNVRVLGKVPALRVSVAMAHPGARSMEFGRKNYWRGYKGRAVKSGYKFAASPGQTARPFLGVISGRSVAQGVQPYAEKRLVDAYIKEWETAHAAAGGNNS